MERMLDEDGWAGTLDLVFLDADKERTDVYYELALELLRPGGVVVVDDALWSGRVADADNHLDPETEELRATNAKAMADPRVMATVVPIYDGMLLAVKLPVEGAVPEMKPVTTADFKVSGINVKELKRAEARANEISAVETSGASAGANLPDHLKSLRGKVISLEGNIGAGKTTLGESITSYLNSFAGTSGGPDSESSLDSITAPLASSTFAEETPNADFLSLFYGAPESYAFAFQMFMLAAAQRASGRARTFAARGRVGVLDRSAWGNATFAACNHRMGRISDAEMAVYRSVYSEGFASSGSSGTERSDGVDLAACGVDCIIYLDASPTACFGRVRARARAAETGVSEDYLERLDTEHFEQLVVLLSRQGGASDEKTPRLVVLNWAQFGSAEEVCGAAAAALSLDGAETRPRMGRVQRVTEGGAGAVGADNSAAARLGRGEVVMLEAVLAGGTRLSAVLGGARAVRVERPEEGDSKGLSAYKRVVLRCVEEGVDVVIWEAATGKAMADEEAA
eukprot:CAMPEP_0184716434 /NCGR_PEP_ID=MMETSP0314-20130426/6165_1 /TAXON_ID=38298 /ORGANISM="Rhodella maculata, Strain CCMP 736" /LENGTH=512 /DNA_ID=CAMNT_0027179833 /DNA_START=1 /DNA_END=1539 /DNA_ORIENTATION=-